MPGRTTILRIALPLSLREPLDYLPPEGADLREMRPGIRVEVPLAKRSCTGLLSALTEHSALPASRLRPAIRLIDRQPLLGPSLLRLLHWGSRYYQHPVGEAFFTALPPPLRRGRPLPASEGPPADANTVQTEPRPQLTREQRQATDAILQGANKPEVYLLEGVTGSGKTEVYLKAIEKTVRDGKQALLLLPEIGLVPQHIQQIERRLAMPMALMHSQRTDRERLLAWLAARAGRAPIVVGTRSAIWTPLLRPGLVVIDEEHDRSYKQQERFRYSARDVAVMRAKIEGIPLILGSATPSLESLRNAGRGRYKHLRLPARVGAARLPQMRLLDVRRHPMQGAISAPLEEAIRQQLGQGLQVLLFLNRRGYSPALLCHRCGRQESCARCDANLTYHRIPRELRCHHCGRRLPKPNRCPDCGGSYLELGHGTQRIEATLARLFPDARIARIDRDRTRRKGTLEALLQEIRSGQTNIMVGTQMIAKGHHLERVTLVGIVDADRGLYSQDFRAAEQMAQQILQVGGRAGRGAHPGTVLIQTHHPEHPWLNTLLREGYPGFARLALRERKAASLPPYRRMVLLQAEAADRERAGRFLRQACAHLHRQLAGNGRQQDMEIWGPFPAPMARRAGRHRQQLVLQSSKAERLREILARGLPELERLRQKHKCRWFIDVDPMGILQ